jgi:bifunctional UDP-N-acetylglucosamine pyrophosphorylase / glucosamine-1-phosphate N-acetyltransferase
MSITQHTSAIILAAGKGTRLNEGQPSEIPKVMHKVCGKPMLEYTLGTLENINISDIVIVVGYKAELIQGYFGDKYKYALQKEQKGTGHAVACAEEFINPANEHILVIQGDDSAFYSPETLVDLIDAHINDKAKVSLLTLIHPQPAELGRIIRNEQGRIQAIKEKEVTTEQEKQIKEINTGTYCFEAKWLWENVKKLKPSATGKGEIILPDLIHLAVAQGQTVSTHTIHDHYEWIGVNTPDQLELANEVMTKRLEHLKVKVPVER